MAVNISDQRAHITWLQYVISVIFIIGVVFSGTVIYKDLEYATQKSTSLRKDIVSVGKQSKRRQKNSEVRLELQREVKDRDIIILVLKMEISRLKAN